MKLTPPQVRFLKLYRSCHAQPPNASCMIRRNLGPLAVFTVIIFCGTYLTLTASGMWFGVGCFGIGLGVGALIRVVRQLACALRVWPVIDQVVDWSKVDSIVSENAGN
jgi:hypothetical protein